LAIPVWTPGQVLASADVDAWFVPVPSYKTSLTSRTSTTLTADPDLTISVAANAVYEVRAMIGYQNPTGASAFSWSFTFPSGATGGYGAFWAQPGPTLNDWGSSWSQVQSAAASDNLAHAIVLQGTLTTSGTAGFLTLTWAPTTASAGAVQVNAAANLIARREG
jgi:hypothetical protein